ncbi:MAG: hypothetical protein CVT89_05640 [Candidatus Altiarchaeales archaeon HGW-Altiarchaeales-2]|nr:MAG: hypothetical protein CVT89_05640 [Candidatus Altiarchaeales archaeon HGW-Altiarchaeales-2]
METIVFEQQVITQLKILNDMLYEMRVDMAMMKNKFEDYFLSDDDKEAIDAALLEEKKRKLASKSDVFG